MKRTFYGLALFAIFFCFFVLMKVVFMTCHLQMTLEAGWLNFFNVIRHGMTMDLAVAAYFMFIPMLVLCVSVFFPCKIFAKILTVYCFVIALLSSAIFIPDIELYKYWGFRIDSTVFNYIDHPKEAVASVSWLTVAMAIAALIFLTIFQYYCINKLVISKLKSLCVSRHKIVEACCIFVAIALFALLARGGITASTMNVGKVYFSENMYLNHAAINPIFNMISSLSRTEKDFSEQYRFMPDEEAESLFSSLKISEYQQDTSISIFKNPRPNIIFIILESCGASVVESLGGEKGVMPNLCRIAEEGLFFRNMYANSFRTDRGLAAIIAGYPAQPDMSIMKYPAKSQHLSSISAVLHENYYHSAFLYGGDVDFAHIKSFLICQKVTDIISDDDFTRSELLSDWGAPDDITFPRFLEKVKTSQEPFLDFFLTLSSHEPFDVPFKKFEEPYLNSVAYTDSCLGKFVAGLKQTPIWENTLLAILPDHALLYPASMAYNSPERHKIYLILSGGALNATGNIDKICMQTDIAATLLNQLNIDASKFIFSRNILHPDFSDFAFYAFPDGFGVVNKSSSAVYDCRSASVISANGTEADSLLLLGKSYLQKLFDDIAAK